MILLLSHSLGVVTGQNKTYQHAPVVPTEITSMDTEDEYYKIWYLKLLLLQTLFKSHNFHFGITTITPLTTLVILVASTWHAPLTLRVYLRIAKRPSAQFANSTNKVLQTRIYEQGFTIQEHPSSIGVLQPYFNSSKGISCTSLRRSVLTRIAVKFFPRQFAQRRKTRKLLPMRYVQGHLFNMSSTKNSFLVHEQGLSQETRLI